MADSRPTSFRICSPLPLPNLLELPALTYRSLPDHIAESPLAINATQDKGNGVQIDAHPLHCPGHQVQQLVGLLPPTLAPSSGTAAELVLLLVHAAGVALPHAARGSQLSSVPGCQRAAPVTQGHKDSLKELSLVSPFPCELRTLFTFQCVAFHLRKAGLCITPHRVNRQAKLCVTFQRAQPESRSNRRAVSFF